MNGYRIPEYQTKTKEISDEAKVDIREEQEKLVLECISGVQEAERIVSTIYSKHVSNHGVVTDVLGLSRTHVSSFEPIISFVSFYAEKELCFDKTSNKDEAKIETLRKELKYLKNRARDYRKKSEEIRKEMKSLTREYPPRYYYEVRWDRLVTFDEMRKRFEDVPPGYYELRNRWELLMTLYIIYKKTAIEVQKILETLIYEKTAGDFHKLLETLSEGEQK
jgi:hypothetical protein